MADWERLGLALQGMGAGFQGQNTLPYNQAAQALSEERKQAAAQDAFQALNLMSEGNIAAAREILEDRLDNLKRTGRDATETMNVLSALDNGDIEYVMDDLSKAVSLGQKYLQPEYVGSAGGQIIQRGPGGGYQAVTPEGFDPTLGGGGDSTWGSSVTLKDENGNLFTQTQQRSGNSMRSVVRAIDGSNTRPQGQLQIVGNMGMTASESIDYAGRKSRATGDEEIVTTRGKENAKDQVGRNSKMIEQGLSALESIPKIERGIELLKRVKTGGIQAASKAVTDFFGTTSGDVGELNRILAQNVLDGLQNFTGAISEGERNYLTSIETSLKNGTAVNERLLVRGLDTLRRKVERAKKAAQAEGDDFALSIFENPGGMTLAPKEDKEENKPAPNGIKFMGFE